MAKLQLLSTQEKQHRHNCLVDIFRRYGIMPSTIHIPIYTNPLINQLRDIRLTPITHTPITPSPLSTDINTKSADNTINEQTKTPVKQDREIEPLDLSLSHMIPEEVQEMLDEYYQQEGENTLTDLIEYSLIRS